ncbi:hypothetical protein [Streptomyces sp. NPDC053367]|uniref:hypothetical protein n=1 Tax=Streptomyces sp. NPDC053367 TaxID=3365700 RepID=UPI0037D33811
MSAPPRPSAYARLVLRIIDARTGEPVEAAPVRRGLTRVEARASGPGLTALRVLLVADLLVRALELGGTPVWAVLSGVPEAVELRAAAAALGVRPFEDGRDVGTGLGEAQVLHVVADGAGGPAPQGVLIGVAAADGTSPGLALSDPDRTDAPDPAVLRLALLARPRSEPLRLDSALLDRAEDTLGRWRRSVAAWAREPSRPIPADVRAGLREAWEDDLDVPGVLRVLERVEAAGPEVPEGARFETYAYADRLLGLELTRDLGREA